MEAALRLRFSHRRSTVSQGGAGAALGTTGSDPPGGRRPGRQGLTTDVLQRRPSIAHRFSVLVADPPSVREDPRACASACDSQAAPVAPMQAPRPGPPPGPPPRSMIDTSFVIDLVPPAGSAPVHHQHKRGRRSIVKHTTLAAPGIGAGSHATSFVNATACTVPTGSIPQRFATRMPVGAVSAWSDPTGAAPPSPLALARPAQSTSSMTQRSSRVLTMSKQGL